MAFDKKCVAISGTDGNVPGVSFLDTETAMKKVGNNCGNLLFQYAVKKIIKEPVLHIGKDTTWNTAEIRDMCRIVVVPSANFLRENFDFSHYVNFLEKIDLPLVFIGLGVQSDNFEKSIFDFHPSILRLIDLIRERSACVSVRGQYTAEVLEKYGLTNIEITGCPSNFINSAPNFHEMIEQKLLSPMQSFITQADEPWPKHQIKSEVERRLVNWTQNGRAVMVQQSVPQVMKYLRKNNPFSNDEIHEHFEERLCRTLMPNANIETFRDFIATKLRTYYSVDQWLEDCSHFDFSIGLRLHGNMVAWQSCTPALWITHDTRTKELVDTMALPNISINSFIEKCESIEIAKNMLEYDKEKYFLKRKILASRTDSVLKSSNIDCKIL